mmetsp:Transcript_10693/g.26462  ORF Transcript_10693/g.26462 Transcript_10693/m.26462 type:complete len:257 (+) Transcript_10693:355-1125(+)
MRLRSRPLRTHEQRADAAARGVLERAHADCAPAGGDGRRHAGPLARRLDAPHGRRAQRARRHGLGAGDGGRGGRPREGGVREDGAALCCAQRALGDGRGPRGGGGRRQRRRRRRVQAAALRGVGGARGDGGCAAAARGGGVAPGPVPEHAAARRGPGGEDGDGGGPPGVGGRAGGRQQQGHQPPALGGVVGAPRDDGASARPRREGPRPLCRRPHRPPPGDVERPAEGRLRPPAARRQHALLRQRLAPPLRHPLLR